MNEEIIRKLEKMGAQKGASVFSESDDATYIEELAKFINSMDFMRLGQAINKKQWQAASMKAMKMQTEAKKLGITGFERMFTGIRQNINRKNSEEALQVMASMIAKRVKLKRLL